MPIRIRNTAYTSPPHQQYEYLSPPPPAAAYRHQQTVYYSPPHYPWLAHPHPYGPPPQFVMAAAGPDVAADSTLLHGTQQSENKVRGIFFF
jgi:hypothetical protein